MKTKRHNYSFHLKTTVFKFLMFLFINYNVSLSLFSYQNLAPASQLNLTISNQEMELIHKRVSDQETRNKVKSVMIKSLMANKWRIDLAAKNLKIHRKKIRKIVGSEFIKERKEEFEKNYILNALESSNWNVSLASQNFNVSPAKIYGTFSKEFINKNRKQIINDLNLKKLNQRKKNLKETIRQRESKLLEKQNSEKTEIIAEIKQFIDQANCLAVVAKELKIPIGTLKDRMKKHQLTLNEIKFDKNRVIPVLIETFGNLRETSKILGIERSILSKRFARQINKIKTLIESIQKTKQISLVLIALKETDGLMTKTAKNIGINPSTLASWVKKNKIQKLSPIEKISYKISNYFFIIDDILLKTFDQTTEIDKRKKDSIHFFLNSTKFKLFNIRSNLKRLNEEAVKNKLSQDIIIRLRYYNDFANSFYKQLDIEGSNRNELLLVLENATKTMNNFIPQMVYFISKLELYKEENIQQKKLPKKPEDKVTPEAETKKPPQDETRRNPVIKDKSQKQDDIQPEAAKITNAIKLFVSQKNCLSDVATYLKLSIRSLKIKMKKYNIYLDEIKFNEARVIPVLIETLADADLTSKILILDKYDLKRRFSKQINAIKNIVQNIQNIAKIGTILNSLESEKGDRTQTAKNMGISLATLNSLIDEFQILSISSFEKRINTVNNLFLNIDDTIIKMHKQTEAVNNRKEDSINAFINSTKFALFRILAKINNLKKELRGQKIDEDISQRLEYYEKYITSLYSIIDNTNEDHFNLLLSYAEITIKMNTLKPQMVFIFNKLKFHSIDHAPLNISRNYQNSLQQSA